LDWIARKHRFSAELQAAAWAAYESLEVRVPMRGYPDLGVLSELAVLRFLVTSGFRRMQESKIRALGIASHFTAIHIDALGDANRVGKEGIFRNILSQHRLQTTEVLVVGDNPDSELEAGNRLGIVHRANPSAGGAARPQCHTRDPRAGGAQGTDSAGN
jgi:putative hydrolase of the HAD superfamily